ncbi:hypothetical protein DFQ27_002922 [Actinomortierella ambigua]|uniref:Protein kinase domain-containing protein n=1 Tax=Actinomortierella ambigua TaxID=1343610 RepID=A0A9P6Q698_9FUNG|nr:hypothetical protein DFQ27_002922 [Actinomortierella ambigua]
MVRLRRVHCTKTFTSSLIVGTYVGGGAYGRVFNAHWEGRKVAVKKFVMPYDEVSQTETIQQEIDMVQRLVDRHIIQFYGITEHEGQLVLVMDYAEGGSLERAIASRRTTEWPTKIRIAQEIARGLTYIHHKNVLHRDLKSMNVLLTRHMEVKLCDFGLATVKTRSSARSTVSFQGTTRWMAPELFTARPKYSNKSDMFALGIVMWELAANCTTPFQEQPDHATVISIVKSGEREVLPDDTPPDYRQWVERCWAQDPGERPEASEFAVKDDESGLGGGPGGNDSALSISQGPSGRFHTAPSSTNTTKAQTGAVMSHSAHQSATSQSATQIDALLARAQAGSADAQLSVASMYASGKHGVSRNDAEAFKWYLQAAEKGSLEALYKTAECFRHGRGVQKNEVTALYWMRQAAEGGHRIAQNGLGWMLRNGLGTDRDYGKALVWFRKSADQEFAPAQNNLGWMYQSGSGTEQDYVQAVYWYRRGAELGDSTAQNNLGTMYKNGHGVGRDYSQAFFWFNKSADQKFAVGLFNLGLMYQKGLGVPADKQKAKELYHQSAAKGHASATSSLIVGSYVGGGAYGRVYNAEWEGRKVAIKKFVLSYDEMDTTLAMKQEIKMLELLVDRHIIQFYGTTHYEGQLVLVMDYAEGGSLEQAILARRTTEWPTKIRIVQETVRGLAYIHHKGVLHRDLKSMNVLLTRHMEVKLCDFGLATVKVRSSARSTISFKGTARWMAPELLNTRPKYSNKSDMFALGMVMWELAANCTTPFQHQPDNFPVMNAVMLGEREVLPDDTPSDYRQWVERCWDHDPAKRPEASEMITKDDDPVMESGHGNHGTTVKLLLDASGRILPHSSGESTQELSGGAVGNALLTNANTSDAEAELSLGRKYASGDGVERNETEAFKWYLQAAEHGSLEATYKTAECYRHGFGVEKNEATAVHWMQLAAERGHHIAQNGLGWMLRNGEGVEQNYDKAISWFRRSAEQGFAPAQNNLGWMYQSGSGTQQDYGLAVSWYRKAAERGDSAAQNNLGAMYKHGHGVDRDYTEAFKWFSKSADGGFSVGLFNLGWLYQMGLGAPKDIQKAIELYRQSAAKGHATARHQLSSLGEPV